MAGKIWHTLGARFTIFIFALTVVTSTAVAVSGYYLYKYNAERTFIANGERLLAVAASFIRAEKLPFYRETFTEDDEYRSTLEALTNIFRNSDATFLYVAHFEQEGTYIFFDTDQDPKTAITLGTMSNWNTDFPEEKKRPFINGETIPPDIFDTDNYGRELVVHRNIRDANGTVMKGWYIAADFAMNESLSGKLNYFGLLIAASLLVAVLFALANYTIIYHTVSRPLGEMKKAVNEFLDDGSIGAQLSSLATPRVAELGYLSESLKDMEKKVWNYLYNAHEASRHEGTDTLTGLHNREAFLFRANMFLYSDRFGGRQNALVVISLDKMLSKETLCLCAATISGCCTEDDEIARITHNDMAIFMPKAASKEAVEQTVREILKALPPEAEAVIGAVMTGDAVISCDAALCKAYAAIAEAQERGADYNIAVL